MAEEYDLNTDELIGKQRILSFIFILCKIINYYRGMLMSLVKYLVLLSSKVALQKHNWRPEPMAG